jgi:hypothetical protein
MFMLSGFPGGVEFIISDIVGAQQRMRGVRVRVVTDVSHKAESDRLGSSGNPETKFLQEVGTCR